MRARHENYATCITYYFYLSYNDLAKFSEKGIGFALIRIKSTKTLHYSIC